MRGDNFTGTSGHVGFGIHVIVNKMHRAVGSHEINARGMDAAKD